MSLEKAVIKSIEELTEGLSPAEKLLLKIYMIAEVKGAPEPNLGEIMEQTGLSIAEIDAAERRLVAENHMMSPARARAIEEQMDREE